MSRLLDELWDHEGYAARKLADGSLTMTDGDEFSAYVAACTCATGPSSSWHATTEHPPTEAGEDAALEQWKREHARPLLAGRTEAPSGVSDEVLGFLDRLGALARERPAAMLYLLRSVELHTDAHLADAVAGARAAGLSWSEIGGQLHMSKQAAQGRWAQAVPTDRPDPRLRQPPSGPRVSDEITRVAKLLHEGARNGSAHASTATHADELADLAVGLDALAHSLTGSQDRSATREQLKAIAARLQVLTPSSDHAERLRAAAERIVDHRDQPDL